MDHLPSFGASSLIHVPYVCTQMYDGGDFFDYPRRRGWDREKLYNGDFEGRTPEETASFLQAWMYFGLLHHVFQPVNPSFNLADFIRQLPGGQREITTEKLPGYVIEWHQLESGNPVEKRRTRFDSMNKCLRELHPFVMRYCGANSSKYRAPPTFWPLSQEISLSIIALADSVMKAGFEITGFAFNLDWGVSAFLVNRVLEAGWCKNAVSLLETAQQVHMLYYASTLGSPMTRRNHESCTECICIGDQINEQEYLISHRPNCSACKFIGPSIDEIVRIIGGGRTPLISYSEENGWKIVAATDKASSTNLPAYIALSHVWADGLGNPIKNTLPECQINYLQHLMDDLQGENPDAQPSLWWCDTLCVPVQDQYKKFRKQAVRDMRRTYQEADKILALDSGLIKLSKESYIIEIYMRLKLSGWMRRLWTLQEGLLAKDVYFQFSDSTMRLRDMDNLMMKEGGNGGQYLYTRYSFDSFTYFGPFLRSQAQNRAQRFVAIWKQLQWRSTSHQFDETICLATILGIDPEPLLEIPQEDLDQRMIKFLQLCGTLPLIILFQPPPRLSQPGYRWAPKSLLACFRNTKPHAYMVLRGTVTIASSEGGITTSLAGLEILPKSSTMPLIGEDFTVHLLPETLSSHVFQVRYIGPVDTGQPDRKAKNVDGSRNLKRPAIILGQSLFAASQVNAILVDLCDLQNDSGCLTANFIAWIGLQADKGPYYPMSVMDQNALKDVWANQLPETQKWLIN